jgi:hypothetical protein
MSNLDATGYLKVEKLIDQATLSAVSQYFENKINRGEWGQKELAVHDSSKFGYYADPLIEVLLKSCLPAVEKETGLMLEPTYSFSRVYQGGEELKPHTDRPSCEISVTVNVACTMSEPWPIWMQYGSNDPTKCMLNPGDAVIYKGCEVMHWRRPLEQGAVNPQFMLHYVIKDGPNAAYKFDKRAALGLPSVN